MTDKEKLIKIKSLADKMSDTAFNITTDASLLKKAIDEYHQFIINEYHKEEQIIKELQEEPVSEKKCMFTKDNYTDEDRMVLCEGCKERCAYAIAGAISTNAQIKKEPVSEEQVKELTETQHVDKTCKEKGNSLTQESEAIDFEQELYKAFGQIKDFTLGIAIAKRFYDMGRKHNESVSEELEEAARRYAALHAGMKDAMTSDFYEEYPYSPNDVNAFKAGAKWKEEQFEKNRLNHCNSITNEQAELEQGFIDQHLDKHQRMPTFLDAIEYGMRLKEKQIMENATEATVAVDAGGYPYIPQMELYDYDKDIPLAKEGDKYKVILIKEE